MTSWIAVAVMLLVVSAFVGLAVWTARGRRGLRRLERERILVTLKTGAWFEGLASVDGDVIALRHVLTGPPAGAGGEPLEVDGEIVVFRSDVDYVQTKIPAGGARAPQ